MARSPPSLGPAEAIGEGEADPPPNETQGSGDIACFDHDEEVLT